VDNYASSGTATDQTAKKLHLKHVAKSFSGRKVVDVEDLTLGCCGIEGLIGPNGAGKTTLMSIITHGLKSDSGEVFYYPNNCEMEISNKRLDEIARLGIVKTNQIIQDFASLTIMDSLLLSLSTISRTRRDTPSPQVKRSC
jgi:ABC-type branched-subunit amino acid transport system ATPase component